MQAIFQKAKKAIGAPTEWLAPLTGTAAVLLVIVARALIGSAPKPGDPALSVATFYAHHATKLTIAAFVFGLAAILLLFFAGWLQRLLREAEGRRGCCPTSPSRARSCSRARRPLAATLQFTLADTADNISLDAVQALNALDYDLFILLAVGLSTLLIASGLSAVRNGVIPKWLRWAALVIGVGVYTPVGLYFHGLGGLWIAVLGVWGARRERSRRELRPRHPRLRDPA